RMTPHRRREVDQLFREVYGRLIDSILRHGGSGSGGVSDSSTPVPTASQQPSLTTGLTDSTGTLDFMAPGTLLSQRYRIEREIGHGGFGTVYLAHDEQLHDKRIVIKIGHEKAGAGDTWRVKKFQEECEALSRIDHPGVVGVLDQGRTSEG